MRIETGTTNERLARNGILTLALCVFAGWFAVDGWYRYPRKALAALQADLRLKTLPEPHPKLAYRYPAEPRRKYGEAVKKGLSKADVLTDLGQPLSIQPDAVTKTDHWHYVGQFGRLKLEVERTADPNRGKVVAWTWEQTPADYRYESVQQQKFFAAVCAVLGLAGLMWWLKVWRTRVVVDETGLTYDRRAIAWERMTALDAKDYHAKGWLTLVYEAGSSERRLRLDSFKIDAFDDVVDAICQRKGFANPLPIDDDDRPDEPDGKRDPGDDGAA